MPICSEISRLYTQSFYPEQLPFQGTVTIQERKENGTVAVQLVPQEQAPVSWPLKIMDCAFHFFAWLRGISQVFPQELPEVIFAGKSGSEEINFILGKQNFKVQLGQISGTPVPFKGTLYIGNNTA